MQTSESDGEIRAIPYRSRHGHDSPHLELPPPPSPSTDTTIVPNLASPSKEEADLGVVPLGDDIDIFALSPLAALRLLCKTAEALVNFTGDVPPTAPISEAQAPRLRVISNEVHSQKSHSRSSSIDRRKSFPPPPEGWGDAKTVPPKEKTPIGSPVSGPAEPLHVSADVESMDTQQGAITRKFYSKKPPPIPLADYLQRLHKWCPMSTAVYLATSLYVYRLAVTQKVFAVTSRNVHRLLLAALRVAMKALEDLSYPHRRFAKVGGITEPELGRLEISFCFVMNFDLKVNAEMLLAHAKIARDGIKFHEITCKSQVM